MLGVQLDKSIEKTPACWQVEPLDTPDIREHCRLTEVRSAYGTAMLKQAEPGKNLSITTAMLLYYEGSGAQYLLQQRHNTQLLEWIDGPHLSDLLAKNKDELAIDIASGVVRKLLSKREMEPNAYLLPLPKLMRPVLELKFSEDPLKRHAARLIRHLLETTTSTRPLHGNLHFNKIMHHSGRGWLSLAPEGLSGDIHYELTPLLCHPSGHPDPHHIKQRIIKRADRLVNNLPVHRDRLLTFAFCYAALESIRAEQSGRHADYWQDMITYLLDIIGE